MAFLKTLRFKKRPNRIESAAGRPVTLREAVRAFKRDEDGALIIFGLYIFMVMILAAGMAVDIMHFETTRARLQSTLDRAILAAADLDQTLDPEGVVEDYFTKAGLRDFLIDVDVDEGLNFRSVSAVARTEMPTFFMHLSGVNTLTAPAAGTAQERITDVEISLVLDSSGSMGSNNKIENLKVAAEEFLDTLYTDPDEEHITVSVIPYATQVSAGPELLSKYNVTNTQNYSYCVDFPSSSFSSTALSTSTSLTRTGHFDPFSSYNQDDPYEFYLVCPTADSRDIIPLEDNKQTLKTAINALEAGGNTSIDIGTKWGAALLDPGTRSVVSSLISDGVIDAKYDGRPFDYDYANGLKVLVVMTDGINTTQYTLNSNRDNEMSGVYRWMEGSTVRYAVDSPENTNYDGDSRSREQYFFPHLSGSSRWQNTLPSGATQLTYQDVWADMPVNTWAYDFYYRQRNRSSDYNNARNSVYGSISDSTKDNRLDTICTAAKNQGVVIFAIGFEVTDASADVMESCASTPSHFFRVEGLEIAEAFRSIASTINRLRLTQ